MQLSEIPFIEPARAQRLWDNLRGKGEQARLFELFAPSFWGQIASAAEPDRALVNFERWIETLGSRLTYYRLFAETPDVLANVLRVFSVSQFLADAVIQNPELGEILLDPALLHHQKSAVDYHIELARLIAPCSTFLLKLDRMRHFKQREYLRIAALDILGYHSLPQTARAISDFADACLQTAYEICHQELSAKHEMTGEPGFAIVGMGKLGARELNYSSDVDLIFLRSDQPALTGRREPETYLIRLAESIVKALSEPMRRGILFRVDLRLRPEGRSGPIVRSLKSACHYYENWAETWERQALLKARFIAGDPQVGETFIRMMQPVVYRRKMTEQEIEEIRHQKRRSEAQVQARGEQETDIKNGWGGIREIEFTVQLLQLIHGGRHPRLRTPNTLDALKRLLNAHVIQPEDHRTISEAYEFLRTVEHRLQLLYEHQTHTLPAEPGERARFAKRMGYQEPDEFEMVLWKHREGVRAFCERYFYDGEMPTDKGKEPQSAVLKPNILLLGTVEGKTEWLSYLTSLGFEQAEESYHRLQRPLIETQYNTPPPETKRAYKEILSPLLSACARTPDPDASLRGIETLASAMMSSASLYTAFVQSPEVLHRLVELAVSPPLWEQLIRHQELLDMLFGEEIVEVGAKPLESYQQQLEGRLAGCRTERARFHNIAAFARRERLRIGARDLWSEAEPLQTAEDLTNLTITLLQAAWEMAARQVEHPQLVDQCLIVGFGRLGSMEPGFTSDWDIGFVAPEIEGVVSCATPIVERFLNLCQQLHTQGAFMPVDLRLRPWGSKGNLIHTIQTYQHYYTQHAEPWERLAATRVMVLAGNTTLQEQFEAVLNDFRYGQPVTPQTFEGIRHLKQRMQSERVKPEEQHRHLKLGRGTLSDIEFTVQWLMLKHYRLEPGVVPPTNTWQMLVWLHRRGVISKAQYEALSGAFRFFYHVQNRLFLLQGSNCDLMPLEGRALSILARSLNYRSPEHLSAIYHSHTGAVMKIVEKVWSEPPA